MKKILIALFFIMILAIAAVPFLGNGNHAVPEKWTIIK